MREKEREEPELRSGIQFAMALVHQIGVLIWVDKGGIDTGFSYDDGGSSSGERRYRLTRREKHSMLEGYGLQATVEEKHEAFQVWW